MKRRLLSAFLAVMMVLTMAPVAFAADEGDTAPQSSVSLPANNTGDFTISEEGAVLDGTNVTYTDGTITVTAANVTIKNLTFGDKAKLVVNTSGKFTLTGCTFAPQTVYNKATELPVRTAVKLNVGEAEVTDNTFEGVTNGYYNAIEFGIGADNNDLKAATISGNTFKSAIVNNYFNFYNMTNGAQIDIVNNKLLLAEKSSNGIRISNYRNVKGVTFNVADDEYTYAADSADSVYEGLILLQDFAKGSDVQNFSGITINVTKLSAPKSAKQLLYVYDDQDGIITTNQPKLTGDDSLAQFYAAKIGDTYYKTLAAAVAEAKNGDTVTLVKDTDQGFAVPAGLSITFDVNGKKLERNGQDIQNDGTLTICDSTKQGAIISKGAQAIGVGHNSNTTIEYANVKSVEGAVITGYATGATITIKDGVFNASDNAVVAGNGNRTDSTGATRVNSNTINILGGTFNGQIKSEGYVACGIYAPWNDNITVNGGIFNITGGAGIVARAGNVTVNGGEFNTTGNVTGKVGDSRVVVPCAALVFDSAAKYPALTNDSKIQIKDGKFKSDVDTIKVLKDDTDTNSRVVVGSGYFTTDPSAYVASGYVAGTSDVSGYSYKVVAKTNTGSVEVKPDVADPEVKVSGSISKEDQAKVAAAAATVSAPTLGAAAVDEAQKINEDKAKELLKDVNVGDGDKKLYVQSSLKVEPTAYNAANKTLALEITPQYRVVASTATTADKIKLDGNKNAQVVQDYQNMTIDTPTEVTMELPTGFAVADGDKLSIQHTKNDTVEYYTGTVTKKDDKFYLTFTTNGFSPFVISVPEASIGENVYPTLQAAVDSVQKNETIKLAKDVDEATVVTVAKSINFKVDTNNKKFKAAKNIVAGSNTTVKVTGESSPYAYEFTYTKPSSGSSGGSSSGKTTYKVTTSAVNNGGVNASPSNAEKGATITLTLSPDKGYKLDKLTVTDGSGKTVSTVKKSDTVYTFTMPASAVKVGVSYVKATETPSETKFNDVSANDWFASAVDYVTGKGMMNGTADNTFSPKANTTRGMVVTVLYRLENQPSTSAASFTDVASGAYYANAVAWANANGIVSGYGSGKFGPNDKVTREQLAAILYRYAQYKKYDVSVGEDTNILSYNDAQSISSYAIPAIQWACGAGVVTGKSGSKLDPKGNATRAEVAAMLMRFCENVK